MAFMGSPQAKFGAHRDHAPGAFASAVAPTFLSAGREAFQPPVVPRGKNASVLAGWKAGVTRFMGSEQNIRRLREIATGLAFVDFMATKLLQLPFSLQERRSRFHGQAFAASQTSHCPRGSPEISRVFGTKVG